MELEFERAARLRDRLRGASLAVERQQMVTETAGGPRRHRDRRGRTGAAVQVFHVRRGRVVGRHGFIVEKVKPLTSGSTSSHGSSSSTTPRLRRDSSRSARSGTTGGGGRLPEAWLSGLRGGKVTLRVPRRGRKRELVGNGPPERRGAAEPPPAAACERPHEPRRAIEEVQRLSG